MVMDDGQSHLLTPPDPAENAFTTARIARWIQLADAALEGEQQRRKRA